MLVVLGVIAILLIVLLLLLLLLLFLLFLLLPSSSSSSSDQLTLEVSGKRSNWMAYSGVGPSKKQIKNKKDLCLGRSMAAPIASKQTLFGITSFPGEWRTSVHKKLKRKSCVEDQLLELRKNATMLLDG